MADNINLDLEADLATKSSGYFGPLLSATVSHGNTFKGAERLKLGLTGGFEWQWGTKSTNQIGNLFISVRNNLRTDIAEDYNSL